MNEIVAALIAATALLAGILFEKLYVLFMDHVQRKKEFFNQFFPERLNAHKEIMRVIAQTHILYLDPKVVAVSLVKEILINARQFLDTALLDQVLFAAPAVKTGLFTFARECGEVGEAYESAKMTVKEREEAITMLKRDYDKLVGLILNYSGIYIIDQEFAKMIKRGKEKGAKTDREIHA
jgi:hypothetical protein